MQWQFGGRFNCQKANQALYPLLADSLWIALHWMYKTWFTLHASFSWCSSLTPQLESSMTVKISLHSHTPDAQQCQCLFPFPVADLSLQTVYFLPSVLFTSVLVEYTVLNTQDNKWFWYNMKLISFDIISHINASALYHTLIKIFFLQ